MRQINIPAFCTEGLSEKTMCAHPKAYVNIPTKSIQSVLTATKADDTVVGPRVQVSVA